MKIAVFADLHANLPALEAALGAIQAEGCEAIFSCGDVIAIGPSPAECLARLAGLPNLYCVRGNHDVWLVDGLPAPLPGWMSAGEVVHQRWTHEQIPARLRHWVAGWPLRLAREWAGTPVFFQHYAFTPGGDDFQPILRSPTPAGLDAQFAAPAGSVVFFGHHHSGADVQGVARYVNPGSLGCQPTAVAPFCVASFAAGQACVEARAIPYDDAPLRRAFAERDVPECEFIGKVFFGGRL